MYYSSLVLLLLVGTKLKSSLAVLVIDKGAFNVCRTKVCRSDSILFTFPPSNTILQEAINMPTVHLLDYVAGNVRSLVNAIEKLGYTVEWVKTPADVAKADVCA